MLGVVAAVVAGLAERSWRRDLGTVEADPVAANPGGNASRAALSPDRQVAVPPSERRDASAIAASLEEALFMAGLRQLVLRDPSRAVAMAREGNRRFPDSPDAPERTSILIHLLVEEEQPMEARGEAEEMVNRYPDSKWVPEIEQFTGAHRHRNVRVNDAGVLVYQ